MEKRLVTTSSAISWSRQGLHEYLLAIQPSADISTKLNSDKCLLEQHYQFKNQSDNKPHIHLATFQAHVDMEPTIIRYMQRICYSQKAFSLSLNNYSGYPPGTIYLRVQNPHPLQKLANELNSISDYITSCACPPVKISTSAHLPVAKQLPAGLFDKALMHFAQQTFHDTFVVSELLLLRRQHPYEPYKAVNIFHLQPLTEQLIN